MKDSLLYDHVAVKTLNFVISSCCFDEGKKSTKIRAECSLLSSSFNRFHYWTLLFGVLVAVAVISLTPYFQPLTLQLFDKLIYLLAKLFREPAFLQEDDTGLPKRREIEPT